MARSKTRHALTSGVTVCTLGMVVIACASSESTGSLHQFGPAEDGGSFDMVSGGTPPSAGTGGSPASAGAGAGPSGGGGAGGTDSSATGGTAGVAGSAATSTGGASSGGTSSAGTGGAVGSGGAIGSAGSGGAIGSGGSGGSGVVDQLLSQGKPATADSEETSKGNLATLGNDGSATTRWCAADGATGHYWQVDLGKSYTLSKLSVSWEHPAIYQFKVEGSPDGTTWSSVLDETSSTNATADQSYPLPAAPTARWVRITTTTLPSSTTWASFFEFQVYGH